MDDSIYFAMADGQFKQKIIKNYSILPIRAVAIPNFTPTSGSGFTLSQKANGKASTGDAFKDS